MPRFRLAMIVLLAAALAAAGCSFGDDNKPSGAAQTGSGAGAAAQGQVDLKGVCPDPIVVQTDWFPETEYGVYYHMLAPNPKMDVKRKRVSAPTGRRRQARPGSSSRSRSGGPATGFKLVSEQLYTDKSITLGQVNTDEAIRFSAKQPTLAVVAPMEISPFMIMWDPGTYPQFNIIADIGKTEGQGALLQGRHLYGLPDRLGHPQRAEEVPGRRSYDGSRTNFVADGGKVAQAGFATSEPYIYEHEVRQWNKPVKYALVNEAGYPFYPQALSIRAADKEKLAPCLKKLVPIVQRAQVDFLANPEKTNAFVLDLVKTTTPAGSTRPGWPPTPSTRCARTSSPTGPTSTLGNFDTARVQRMIDIVTPIFTAQRSPPRKASSPRTSPPTSSWTRASELELLPHDTEDRAIPARRAHPCRADPRRRLRPLPDRRPSQRKQAALELAGAFRNVRLRLPGRPRRQPGPHRPDLRRGGRLLHPPAGEEGRGGGGEVVLRPS